MSVLAHRQAEFVNGSRLVYPMAGKAMRFLNLLANKVFAALFSWILGQSCRDTLFGASRLNLHIVDLAVRARGRQGRSTW